MREDLREILLDESSIKSKVKELGSEITKDYAKKELFIIGILKGASVFMSDLIRSIDLPLSMDFMAVSSYGKSTESSGVVRIIKDLDESIEGKDVIIVEDIIDTGLTLAYLVDNLKSRGCNSVSVCTLLDKPERRLVDVNVKYVGFKIPDAFVVGYGLDYAEKYRNLPDISILKEEVYSK